MKIKTKFLIALGTPIAAITPVVAVVSCGTSSSMAGNENAITPEEVKAYKAELKAWQDDFADYPWAKTAIVEKHVDEEAFFNADLTRVRNKSGKNHGEFYLPKFIDAIGDGAFWNAKLNQHFQLIDTKTGMTGYSTWRGVKSIGEQAFKGVDFTTLDASVQDFLPDSVWKIENEGFNSSKINSGFKVKQSVIELGADVFAGCIIPTQFSFNPDMSELSDGTFSAAKLTESLTLPEKMHVIGERAFQGVEFTGGKKLNMSKDVYKFRAEAFEAATFDYLFEVPDTIQELQDKVFAQAVLKEGIKIGEQKSRLTVIPTNAFTDAQISQTFDWSKADGITIISEKAFVSAALPANFTLPVKIKSIASQAFQNVDFTGINVNVLIPKDGVYTIEKLAPSSFQGVKLPAGFKLWEAASKLTSQMLGQAFVNVIMPDGKDWSERDTMGPKPGAIVR